MGGFNIRLRIWRSIGIFIVGCLLSTVVDQLGRLSSEHDLHTISNVLVPAAQSGRDAAASFDRLVKGYADSFLMQDPSGLDRANAEGARVLECLDSVAGVPGVPEVRSSTAHRLAQEIRRYITDADVTYRQAPSASYGMPEQLQNRIRHLGAQADELRTSFASFDAALSSDLKLRMRELRIQSARLRVFSLSLLSMTLIVAVLLVNDTIGRSIIRPLSKMQSELAHEQDLLRILLDHIPDYIYFKGGDGKFIRINQALASAFGIKEPEEAIGRTDADYFDADTAARIFADDRGILRSGRPVVSKVEQVTRSGLSRWLTTTKVPVPQGPSIAPVIVGISRDITQFKETMEALQRSEASFRLLFSAIPHAVFVCDVETLAIVEVNEAATRIYGYSPEEFRRMRLSDVYPASDRAQLKQTVEELGPASPWHGHRKHVTKDGRRLDVEIADHLLEFHGRKAILVMAQDVSEQKHLELELRQAQRLEAVGQLAAGIAHEINTPIQYVSDNLRFLCDAFKDRQAVFSQYERLLKAVLTGGIPGQLAAEVAAARDQADLEYLNSEIPKAMEQSLDGVERVAAIVRAMKAFAHPGSSEKMPADLNKALSDALTVARNELKYVADVVTDFAELPPVWCHLADLNQVFLNLLVNAAHAIGDVVKSGGARGVIGVQTRCQNNQVTISISDTGCGIPAEIQPRVFDPFFTTKEVGKGTGQGLAIARNIIVEKHGGRIAFEPNVSQGTTFVVSLPVDGASGEGNESIFLLPEGARA